MTLLWCLVATVLSTSCALSPLLHAACCTTFTMLPTPLHLCAACRPLRLTGVYSDVLHEPWMFAHMEVRPSASRIVQHSQHTKLIQVYYTLAKRVHCLVHSTYELRTLCSPRIQHAGGHPYPQIDPEWLVVDNMPRVRGISPADFRERFEIPNRPVVLEVTQGWKRITQRK